MIRTEQALSDLLTILADNRSGRPPKMQGALIDYAQRLADECRKRNARTRPYEHLTDLRNAGWDVKAWNQPAE